MPVSVRSLCGAMACDVIVPASRVAGGSINAAAGDFVLSSGCGV